MFRQRCGGILGVVFFVIVGLLPESAFAQSGTIAGLVRDTSGGVLPGVTVEAASPALIEKVRSAVTDGSGQYKLVDLRPGTYTVTFTLPGFSTVRRDGIELSAGVTANVNVELRVGNLEETITVSGEAPLVDIQSTTQHRGIERAIIDALPTGRQWSNYAVFVPGATRRDAQDVGGSAGDGTVMMSIHGSMASDTPKLLEGMRYGNINANMNQSPHPMNNAMIQEIAIDTGGSTADADVSGMRANIILKQGGNTWTGYFYGDYTNDSMQASNLDATLIARGVPTPTLINKIWDIDPAFGGPLKRDKLWFYGSYRYYGLTQQPSGAFYAKDPLAYTYTPDIARGPVRNPTWTHSQNVRLTWQTSRSTKIAFYADHSDRCQPCSGASATTAYEASTHGGSTPFVGLFQGTWQWVRSNRLLFELGETYKPESITYPNQPEVPDTVVGIIDSGLGFTYRAPTAPAPNEKGKTYNGKASATYVTGSHNLKIGAQWQHGHAVRDFKVSGSMNYTFVNGTPTSLTMRSTPSPSSRNLNLNLGVFVQEQWTRKRLTTNLGVRFDYVNAYIPRQILPPGLFVPARDFPAVYDVPDYKDVNPRLGVSYDLLGNGRTALKWNMGRFVQGIGTLIADVVNPTYMSAQPLASSATRRWTDANKNFIPDCDLNNPVANLECGPNNNVNFGTSIVPFNYAPGAATGWGKRLYNWETMVGVQHQLRPGLSIDASYNRRWFGNLTLVDNQAVTANDFDPFCIQAPTNPSLPGGGGNQICGFYNVTPSLFGQNKYVVTQTKNYGEQTMVYDGVDFTASARFPRGIQLQGGTSTGRKKENLCGVVMGYPNLTIGTTTITSPYPSTVLVPATTSFCNVVPPFQTQAKLLAVYPLPWWNIQTSATFQSLPGPEIQATWAAPASAVVGLGRPLAGSASTVSVPLVPSGTMFGDRLNQLDVRAARTFKVRNVNVLANLDLYNLFNANPVLTLITAYGSNWQKPATILGGRMLKVGVQVTF